MLKPSRVQNRPTIESFLKEAASLPRLPSEHPILLNVGALGKRTCNKKAKLLCPHVNETILTFDPFDSNQATFREPLFEKWKFALSDFTYRSTFNAIPSYSKN